MMMTIETQYHVSARYQVVAPVLLIMVQGSHGILPPLTTDTTTCYIALHGFVFITHQQDTLFY